MKVLQLTCVDVLTQHTPHCCILLQVRIHPSSINNQLMVAEPPQGSSGECPIILFEEITRGEAQLYVRQCTLATAHALLLVAAHLGISQDEPGEEEVAGEP